MARIRTIKPGFFTSEDVANLSLRARLTWIGLWTHADDAGRAKDNARLILAALWPLDDVTVDDVEADLAELEKREHIVRYEVDGRRFIQVCGWEHQRINRPSASPHPAPPQDGLPAHALLSESCPVDNPLEGVSAGQRLTHPSVSTHGPLTPGGGREGKGKEGGAPPRRCAAHLQERTTAPCRPCGDARRDYDAWVRAERSRPTPTPGLDGAPPCPEHPYEAAHHCRSCAADRKAAR